MTPINRLQLSPESDQLVPGTRIEHLLSEEQRQLAMRDSAALKAFGEEMSQRLIRETLYPIFYKSVREQFNAGVSQDDIRTDIQLMADADSAAVYREACEDALAGLPPRLGDGYNS